MFSEVTPPTSFWPFPVLRQAKPPASRRSHRFPSRPSYCFPAHILLVYLWNYRSYQHDSMEHHQHFNIPPWDTTVSNDFFDPIFQTDHFSQYSVDSINYILQDQGTSSNTPDPLSSSDSRPDSPLETAQIPKSRKRRQRSEDSQSEALNRRPRKTRTVRAPQETAKVREMGACLTCKRKRKEVSSSATFLISSSIIRTNVEIVPSWRSSRRSVPTVLRASRQDHLHPRPTTSSLLATKYWWH